MVKSTAAYHRPNLVGGLREDPLRMVKKHQPQLLQQGKRHLRVSPVPAPTRIARPSFRPMLPYPSKPPEKGCEEKLHHSPPPTPIMTSCPRPPTLSAKVPHPCSPKPRPSALHHGGRNRHTHTLPGDYPQWSVTHAASPAMGAIIAATQVLTPKSKRRRHSTGAKLRPTFKGTARSARIRPEMTTRL
jgi:hypothetical protein